VYAYAENDPTVIGGKLLVSRSEMRFVDPKRRLRYGEYRSFSDSLSRCTAPVLRNVGRFRFNVKCAGDERFGPDVNEQTFRLITPTKMRIEWYDGLVMYLSKRG
jgi:hypothetical protein